jgi:hypothetical protein
MVDTIPDLPWTWGLYLGDIASNFRACLDHVAWAIVSRGSRPPSTLSDRQQKQVYFPIARDPANLRDLLKQDPTGRRPRKGNDLGYLPGARLPDLAIVRRYQPYHVRRRRDVPFQCLSVLADINNRDKHREVQPTLTFPTAGQCEIDHVSDCVVTDRRTRARTQPMQLNTEIRTIRVRKTGPRPLMQARAAFATKVGLSNSTPIIEWADTTTNWIGALLKEFSDAPPYLT